MKTIRKIKVAIVTLMVLTTTIFSGCRKENMPDENATGGIVNGYSKMSAPAIPILREGAISVEMTNLSTAPYGKVDVEILGVAAHYWSKSGNDEFVTLPIKAGIYDLLEIEKYLSASLVNAAMIPIGKIDRLRLTLGTHNTVVTGSRISKHVYPLVLAGRNNLVDVEINSEIEINKNLNVLLDFNVASSVSYEGNGIYILNPVIKRVFQLPTPNTETPNAE